MKKLLIASIFVTLIFSFVFPTALALKNPILEESTTDVSDSSLFYSPSADDDDIVVRLINGEEIIPMTMTDYLIGAVAAEMPASFEAEALKAQAVALRTYALYKTLVTPDVHPDGDVCSSPSCCASWADDTRLMEKWGDDYSTYLTKIMSAVSETNGLYLSYDSQPALAVFHSSSAGQTEDSSAVWGTSLPYLVSVETPEDESSVPNYISSVTISAEEFMDAFPNSDFSEDISNWMENPIYDESGRLSSVTIGGTTVSGTDLRKLFSLRSTAITFSVNDNEIVLTCTGYGHGVGMSQYGANALSKLGYTFEEILENYYPGTVLSKTYDLSAEIKNQTIG